MLDTDRQIAKERKDRILHTVPNSADNNGCEKDKDAGGVL